jgi:hypothetical protein
MRAAVAGVSTRVGLLALAVQGAVEIAQIHLAAMAWQAQQILAAVGVVQETLLILAAQAAQALSSSLTQAYKEAQAAQSHLAVGILSILSHHLELIRHNTWHQV